MTAWLWMQPTIEEVLPKFLEFCKGAVMVAHNAGFDMSFIIENCKRLGIDQDFTVCGYGRSLARMLLPGLNRFKLDTVAKALNISLLKIITGQWTMRPVRRKFL